MPLAFKKRAGSAAGSLRLCCAEGRGGPARLAVACTPLQVECWCTIAKNWCTMLCYCGLCMSVSICMSNLTVQGGTPTGCSAWPDDGLDSIGAQHHQCCQTLTAWRSRAEEKLPSRPKGCKPRWTATGGSCTAAGEEQALTASGSTRQVAEPHWRRVQPRALSPSSDLTCRRYCGHLSDADWPSSLRACLPAASITTERHLFQDHHVQTAREAAALAAVAAGLEQAHIRACGQQAPSPAVQ